MRGVIVAGSDFCELNLQWISSLQISKRSTRESRPIPCPSSVDSFDLMVPSWNFFINTTRSLVLLCSIFYTCHSLSAKILELNLVTREFRNLTLNDKIFHLLRESSWRKWNFEGFQDSSTVIPFPEDFAVLPDPYTRHFFHFILLSELWNSANSLLVVLVNSVNSPHWHS